MLPTAFSMLSRAEIADRYRDYQWLDASHFIPNFGQPTHDAVLVLKEEDPTYDHSDSWLSSEAHTEAQEPGSEPDSPGYQRVQSLRAQRAVLESQSDYFQSKLKNWSSTDSKPQIVLHIPHGQMRIGHILVKAMHSQLPDELSQQELLQLLALADSYKIDKVTSAVVSRISSMPLDKLRWTTVLAAEQLPADDPLYAPALAAAKTRFMQLLGDLDMVWGLATESQRMLLRTLLKPDRDSVERRARDAVTAVNGRVGVRTHTSDSSRQIEVAIEAQTAAAAAAHSTFAGASTLPHELLMQLPFSRLVQLLSDKDLKAASENAVYHTITSWLRRNQATTQQRKQLASMLRLSNCTPNYLVNKVLKQGSGIMQYLPRAALVAAVTGAVSKLQPGRLSCSEGTEQAARPASALCALDLAFIIFLTDVRAAYMQAVRDGKQYIELLPPDRFSWQGVTFQLVMGLDIRVVKDDAVDAADLRYVNSMHLELRTAPKIGGLAEYSGNMVVWKREGSGGPGGVRAEYLQQQIGGHGEADRTRVYFMIEKDRVDAEVVQPHAVADRIGPTWPDVVQELARRELIQSRANLYVTAQVTHVY